jgi:hypothetical protein
MTPVPTSAFRTAPAEAGCVCEITWSTVVATALRLSRGALLTTAAALAGSSGGGTFCSARITSSMSFGAANTPGAAAKHANAVNVFIFMSFFG